MRSRISRLTRLLSGTAGNGANGKSSTSNFLSGLMKSVPPLEEVFALGRAWQLPELLGKKLEEQTDTSAADKTSDGGEPASDAGAPETAEAES